MPNYFEIWPIVFDRRFLKVFHSVAMATRILHSIKIFEQFKKGQSKDFSCEVW